MLDSKRAILNAADSTGNPMLARRILIGLLQVLQQELESIRDNPENAPTSVTINVDPVILSNPALLQVRNYLINLGYSVTANVPSGLVTLSW